MQWDGEAADPSGSDPRCPEPGSFVIVFTSTSTGSQLTYTTVAYGGYPDNACALGGNHAACAISVNGSSLVLDHSTVRNSAGVGIMATNSTLSVTNSAISNNGSYGIFLTGSTGSTITGNTIGNNSRDGIGVYSSIGADTISGNTISGNGGYTSGALRRTNFR